MAVKYIESIKRIHRLQNENKVVYLCGDFTRFVLSNPSIDHLLLCEHENFYTYFIPML
jgi:hypothetical protein